MSLSKSALVLGLLVGFGAVPAVSFAQDASSVEVPNSKFTYIGEINGSGVNVRSGPADSYYPVVTLAKGDRIVVVGHKFEWLKIEAPQGTFSLVHKSLVERQGAGDQGVIKGENVMIRAGSTKLSPPIATPQLKVENGTPVTILGEQNDMFKIKPPQGAYVYVLKTFVDPVREATTEEATPVATPRVGRPTTRESVQSARPPVAGESAYGDAGRNDAGPQGTNTDLVPVPPLGSKPDMAKEPAAAAPDQAAEPRHDAIAKFRSLEEQFKQTQKQPLDQRPIQEMLDGYQALLDGGDLPAISVPRARLQVKYLGALALTQKDMLDAQSLNKQLATKQTEFDTQQKQIEEKIKSSGVQVYAAVGKLDISTIKKDETPLLRLIDPGTARTLVYIQPNEKVRNLIGQYVGVRGEVVKDERLGVNIIDPTEAATIEAAKIGIGAVAPIQPVPSVP